MSDHQRPHRMWAWARTCALCACLGGLMSVEPANPNASPEARQLLDYLHGIRGDGIVTGEHNEQEDPTDWDRALKARNGNVEPALWGNDFRYGSYVQYRQRVIDEAIRQHRDRGKIITLMYHQVRPWENESSGSFSGSVQGDLSYSQFEQLLTPGTGMHDDWRDKMDDIAGYLQQLEDARVPVLFRPYHEMNGQWFWWGGKRDNNQYKRLFRMTFDYLTHTKGLDNLLWVLNYDDLNNDLMAYHPGDDYIDAVATDIYSSSISSSHYRAMQQAAAGKLLAIGEIGPAPSMSNLRDQFPDFTWIMGWRSLFVNNNSSSTLGSFFAHPYAINASDLDLDATPTPPPATEDPGPYGDGPIALPGRIEAEHYDRGGPGEGYQDSDTANQGGAFRTDAVDIEATADTGGGYNVGWTADGEWLQYTVTASAGAYDLSLRVASNSSSPGSFRVSVDGQTLGTLAVPATGGWQTWTTVTLEDVTLPAGESTLRVTSVGQDTNLNWISLAAATADPTPTPDPGGGDTPVAVHGHLSVEGNRIVDQYDRPVAFAGNSLFWSNTGWSGEDFWHAGTVEYLATDWNSQIVRAAMGVDEDGGYFDDPSGNLGRLRTVVDAAVDNGLYVIIDWHSHHAHENPQAAIEFFEMMARDYGHLPNVIYEIYNEPENISWSSQVKPYAQQVVAAIRAIDPDNLIAIGNPKYDQEVHIATADPVTGYDNLLYVVHFYAATHGQWLRDRIRSVQDRGYAVIITEWGTVNAYGNGDVDETETRRWVEFMQDNLITHVNWSVNDKNESSSIFLPGTGASGPWSDADLTESGRLVKGIIDAWEPLGEGNGGGTASPYGGQAIALPGTIQAEHYDLGGEGVAYHDSDATNQGGALRSDGVDLEATTDSGGGYNLGWTADGEWVQYTVAPVAGRYDIELRVASDVTDPGAFRLSLDGTVLGTVEVPATGGWQTYATVTLSDVAVAGGEGTLRVESVGSGTNLDWIRFVSRVQNSFSTRINFQPGSAAVPGGYLVDDGSAFASRNGLGYGWDQDVYQTRDRNSANASDQRTDTLNHMQKAGDRRWELAVPDGMYLVHLVCGDPAYTDQINTLSIEGTVVSDPDGQDRYDEYEVTVTVSDGRLTIEPASGASNAKLCYIDVDAVSAASN